MVVYLRFNRVFRLIRHEQEIEAHLRLKIAKCVRELHSLSRNS